MKTPGWNGMNVRTVDKPAFVGIDTTQHGIGRFRLGAAAPHDDYPLGGIRISGLMPPIGGYDFLYDCGSTDAGTSMWYAATTANIPPIMAISPTAYAISTVTASFNMFGSDTSATPVADIARWFRQFRFRKLSLVFNTKLGSNSNGSIQIAYDNNLNALYGSGNHSMSQYLGAGQLTHRFPWWEPERVCALIDEKRSTRADKLFYTNNENDGISIATQPATVVNDYFQGGVTAITDGTHVTTGASTVGKFMWDFELDLYGYTPTVAVSLTLSPERKKMEEQFISEQSRLKPVVLSRQQSIRLPSSDAGDQKTSLSAPSRRPSLSSDEKSDDVASRKEFSRRLVTDDFVELTPVSRRVGSKK
jgi:hypothetical protein